MPDGASVPSIAITHLAAGPCPPTAANATWPNVLHTRVSHLVAELGPGPWAKRIIADERQLVTLISSPSGTGNRPHWPRDFDEWWGGVSAEDRRGGPSRGARGARRPGSRRRDRPRPPRRRGSCRRNSGAAPRGRCRGSSP